MQYHRILIIGLMTLMLGQSTYAAGFIGASVSRHLNEQNIGLLGKWEHTLSDNERFKIEGDLQSGDAYRGNVNVALGLDVWKIGVELTSRNKLKGYALDTLGRTNDIGASIVTNLGGLNVSVGIFGRNGNPFAKPSALGTLAPLGYNEDELLSLGLDTVYPADRGLTIKGGSSLLAGVETELKVSRFDIELIGLIELLGKGERVDQLRTKISTGGAIGVFDWKVFADVETQKYGNILEQETALLATVGIEF